MRRALKAACRLLVRIFFRRIEVIGVDRIPHEGSVLFVLNHPNGLVDPMLVLCVLPREVSFLAKAPLFKVPILGALIRSLDAIPVYRARDDQSQMYRNEETFSKTRTILEKGGTVAIFPEGVSHSDTKLKPLKSGAARMALGSRVQRLRIVPAGLYYTRKWTFRSSALLYYGSPIDVVPVPPEENGEPPAEEVRKLTDRIRDALSEVTLQVDNQEALILIEKAERIFSAAAEEPVSPYVLGEHFELRKVFVERYSRLLQKAPRKVQELSLRIHRFESELAEMGLTPDELSTRIPKHRIRLLRVVRGLSWLTLLSPLALAGVVTHFPAYQLTDWLTKRLSKEQDDVAATFKVLGAALLLPLTWILFALFAGFTHGWTPGWITFLLLPVCGYTSLRFLERAETTWTHLHVLWFLMTRRDIYQQLRTEQAALREEMLKLAQSV